MTNDLSGYEIEDLVGRGGMSLVYRAEHVRLRRKVALKFLDPQLAADDEFRGRFISESRAAAAIDHPNVIPIYDAGHTGDVLYIAMRYVDGADLARVLQMEGPMEVDRAIGILAQVARALDEAHAHGIVHRDVKPGNVLISAGRPPEAEHAYLSDFGITTYRDTHAQPTGSGRLLGTLGYVAPEQIEGRPVDGRADVYSLACVLFECLAGVVPFRRDNDAAVLYAHLREAPPRLTVVRPGLPAALDAVIERGLAKTPDERFPSATALMDAALVAGGTARTRPAVTSPLPSEARAQPRRARRRGALAVVAVVAVATAAVGGAALLRSRGEPVPTSTVATAAPTISGRGEGVRLVPMASGGADAWVVSTGPSGPAQHSAQWTTRGLRAASYRVEAFIPPSFGNLVAVYHVRFGDGRSSVAVPVDQAQHQARWVDLGVYGINGPRASVGSDDAFQPAGKELAWASLRWTAVGPYTGGPPITVEDPTSFAGPPEAVERLSGEGFEGDLWRAVAVGEGAAPRLTVEWVAAKITAGTYRVDVYLPGTRTVATVSYVIPTADGPVTVAVNQGVFGDLWVTLGTYRLSGPTSSLTSDDAARPAGQELAWDAVRWTRVA